MKTGVVEQYKGSLKGSKVVLISSIPLVSTEVLLTVASGSDSSTQKAPETLNPTSTSILERLFSYLSSSSRAVKLLSVSYWIFTALSCIAFFIFPWYLFLAFLIPALIMLLIREALDFSQRLSNYRGPA